MAENKRRGLATDGEAAAHKSRRARVSADADAVPVVVFLHVGRTAVVVVFLIRTIILAVAGVELLATAAAERRRAASAGLAPRSQRGVGGRLLPCRGHLGAVLAPVLEGVTAGERVRRASGTGFENNGEEGERDKLITSV